MRVVRADSLSLNVVFSCIPSWLLWCDVVPRVMTPVVLWLRTADEESLQKTFSLIISPELFSIRTGICIKELIGSAVLFPIPPLSKLPPVYSLLCVFLLVHLQCVVFLEQVQLVTNWHQGEIFTIQQSSNKKHTLQMQQLKQSKLTRGLESPKWTGCQTTVSTYNFLGSKVELLVFCW